MMLFSLSLIVYDHSSKFEAGRRFLHLIPECVISNTRVLYVRRRLMLDVASF